MSQQPPFDLGITSQVAQTRSPSILHRTVAGVVLGTAGYLLFRRFGHHKLVRLAYAAPMGYGLALPVALVLMFVLYIIGVPLFGVSPTLAEQMLTEVLPAVLVFLYFGTRWTRKFYRKLTRP